MKPTVLRIARVIRAPREKVFAAWTEPASLQKWWGPGATTCTQAEVDLREGGAYRLANLDPDGKVIWISGTFVKIAPPEELAYTWLVSNLPGESTLVRVAFFEHAQGTELVLTHERFAAEAVREMHAQGWNACIDKLEAFLARADQAWPTLDEPGTPA